MTTTPERIGMRLLNRVAVGALALTVGFPVLHIAAQDQAPPPPAAADQQSGPNAGPEPGYPVQGPQNGPDANQASPDGPQNQQQNQPPPQPYPPYANGQGQNRPYPNYAPPPQRRNVPLPQTLVLPAGTIVLARTTNYLSSDKNQSGDMFTATLEAPLVANGWVVARRGQVITGKVVTAQKAPRGSGSSQLSVELAELTTVDGQVLPIHTQLVESAAGRSEGREVGTVGATTGLGAIIGGAAAGGQGAAIGAGIGAATGLAGVLSTRGRPTIIPAEALLTFRLQDPVSISTEQGQAAFHTSSPADYGQGDQDAYAQGPQGPQRYVGGPEGGPYAAAPYYYYPPYPYYYGYGYGFYPGPFFGGYYGGYYGGFRGGFRGGYGGGFRGGRR